jgi:segregation and condensation protein A
MDYQVDLDIFRGPLDLLLYLVKRDEVDILDIPISRILDQFVEHLRVLEYLDVERVGEFLVMAATLIEIKSKMVLPRSEGILEEEEDPRLELVRQLIAYKQFKDAAALLESAAERQSSRLGRQAVPEATATDPAQQPLRAVELWDLVSAFGRLMRETMALQPQQIVVDQTPLHVYMEQILERLQGESPLPLRRLFTPPHTRGRLVGLFLAVLELTKGRCIIPEQPEAFGDIVLTLAPASAAVPPEPVTSATEPDSERQSSPPPSAPPA